jgi:phosphoglycolate phosphatase-like HAD superfamily hydrolase
MTMPNLRRLVLFDIDGTLLHCGGAGRRAIEETIQRVYGRSDFMDGFRFAGKTDCQILSELLQLAGLPEEEIEAGVRHLLELFPRQMEQIIGEHETVLCPGIPDLVDALRAHPGVEVALLTGNVEAGAFIKLAAAGIRDRFSWGAFGGEAVERSGLPAIAVDRAQERTGYRFTGKEIAILGDTPADILCGRSLDVRSIAVGTGPFDCQKLAEWQPDHCFADLSPTDEVIAAILAP